MNHLTIFESRVVCHEGDSIGIALNAFSFEMSGANLFIIFAPTVSAAIEKLFRSICVLAACNEFRVAKLFSANLFLGI